MNLFSVDINLIKMISAYEAKNNLFLKVSSGSKELCKIKFRKSYLFLILWNLLLQEIC